MSHALSRLSNEARRRMIAALESGRLKPPFNSLKLESLAGKIVAEELAAQLAKWASIGLSSELLAEMLKVLDEQVAPPKPTLVWTGPEDTASEMRDTGVVVRELFGRAASHVLIAGFAIYQGQTIFEPLAARMQEVPELVVDMYLHVGRTLGDETDEGELLVRFARHFRDHVWPGGRLPNVFYDPRGLEFFDDGVKRSALHAKCVVVDRRHALVSSANFTEAAQERNIELGILVEDAEAGEAIWKQFGQLAQRGFLKRVPGLG